MMIMRIKSSLFISLCLILLTMSITAQDKQLSLHDLIPGGKTYSRFVPRDLKQLRCLDGGKSADGWFLA